MRKRSALAATLAIASATVLVAAGCGDDDSSGSAASTTSPAAAEQPSVSFAAPADGTRVGQPVTAKANLEGFTLSPDTVGKPPKGGQGHLHFSMDGGKFDLPKYSGANGQLAVTLGVQGKYSPSVTPSITYKNLPAGEHRLEVYLANNDHSNVGPEAETTFTVEEGPTASAGSPSVSFAAPADGATVGQPVAVRVELKSFTLSPETVGKPPKAGQGHLHFSMDGGKLDFPKYSGANGQLAVQLGVQGKYSPSVTPSITYKDLPAGEHRLEVYLANNDHSNVGPGAETTFTVQ